MKKQKMDDEQKNLKQTLEQNLTRPAPPVPAALAVAGSRLGDNAPRRLYTLRADVEKHGGTDGCPGCVSIIAREARTARHTDECRQRIEELLARDETGAMRLAAYRLRGDAVAEGQRPELREVPAGEAAGQPPDVAMEPELGDAPAIASEARRPGESNVAQRGAAERGWTACRTSARPLGRAASWEAAKEEMLKAEKLYAALKAQNGEEVRRIFEGAKAAANDGNDDDSGETVPRNDTEMQ